MSEQLTDSELNWIEGWIDALDADTYAAGILRKMVAALQSAPPASEPEDGWTDYWRAINNATGPAHADRPYGDIPDEDINLLYDNKWSLYDSDESSDRPECSVCNDAPTTPFCSSCGQRPTQSDRPEPPLREGAMRAAEGCDSPHPDGDRPEPSEALPPMDMETINTLRNMDMEEGEIQIVSGDGWGDIYWNENARKLAALFRQSISQPAPAVPEVIREATFLVERLREFEGEIADTENARDWHGHVAPSIARLESTLDTHPADGDSPAVPEQKLEELQDAVVDLIDALAPDLSCECDSGDRVTPPVECNVHRVLELLPPDQMDLLEQAIAAAPTPTDDGGNE